MKTWKNGAIIGGIIGLVLSIVLGVVSLGHWNPLGPNYNWPHYYFGFHIIVGAIAGIVIGELIKYYKSNNRMVKMKYPLRGFAIFFVLLYFGGIVNQYLEYGHFHRNVFMMIVFGPLMVLFNWKVYLGLIVGYLAGISILNREKR